MEYLIVCVTAFAVSGLTLFSGFGLGTLLMPAFALFFPIEIAVAQTAVVHFANNLFKLALVGRYADRRAVVGFGVPAILAAFAGAWLLVRLSERVPLATYQLAGRQYDIQLLAVIVGALMVIFAFFEILPRLANLSFDRRYLPLGGILSGFFGGLSGHQGALRSAFLIKTGLSKEAFISTGVTIACLVDFVRIGIYGVHFLNEGLQHPALVAAATVCAFAGAYLGRRLMKKITLRAVQLIVAILLIIVGIGLGSGII